jgi:hypothetical protein
MTYDVAKIKKLVDEARTGTGLCEKTNEQGHTIRDAWVHKMLSQSLPEAIEGLLVELERMVGVNSRLVTDFNTLNQDGARLEGKIASLTAELALYKAGLNLASELSKRKRLAPEDVEWVTNDLAELGVKTGDQFFFLYKGDSFVYGHLDDEPTVPPVHDESDHRTGYKAGDRYMWRLVGKREFGECCHPLNTKNPAYIGTVSLQDGNDWQPIPAAEC